MYTWEKKQEDETSVFITGRGKRADIGESYFTIQKSKRLSHWYVIKHWRGGGDRFPFRLFSFRRHFHILAFFLAFVILVVAASEEGGETKSQTTFGIFTAKHNSSFPLKRKKRQKRKKEKGLTLSRQKSWSHERDLFFLFGGRSFSKGKISCDCWQVSWFGNKSIGEPKKGNGNTIKFTKLPGKRDTHKKEETNLKPHNTPKKTMMEKRIFKK